MGATGQRGGGGTCVGSSDVTMLLKSTVLVSRSGFPGIIQVESNTMVVGSLSLKMSSSQFMTDWRKGWNRSSRIWILERQWM